MLDSPGRRRGDRAPRARALAGAARRPPRDRPRRRSGGDGRAADHADPQEARARRSASAPSWCERAAPRRMVIRRQHRRGDDRGQDGDRHHRRRRPARRSPPCCRTRRGRTRGARRRRQRRHQGRAPAPVRGDGPLLRPGGAAAPRRRASACCRSARRRARAPTSPARCSRSSRSPASTSSATSRGATSSTARSTSSSATASSATWCSSRAEALAEMIARMLRGGDAAHAGAPSWATCSPSRRSSASCERTRLLRVRRRAAARRQRRLLHRPRPLERARRSRTRCAAPCEFCAGRAPPEDPRQDRRAARQRGAALETPRPQEAGLRLDGRRSRVRLPRPGLAEGGHGQGLGRRVRRGARGLRRGRRARSASRCRGCAGRGRTPSCSSPPTRSRRC